MSITNAILGLLSCQSATGYDLKKIIQDSPFMPWSGNNNQIYKVLVELLDDGFVTNETHHQEGAPSKKIYTITAEGLAELRRRILLPAEPPEFKKTFLLQLAWANSLTSEELSVLIDNYEQEIRAQMLLLKEQNSRATAWSPQRSDREATIWNMIHMNLISSYENELRWTQHLRETLFQVQKEDKKLNYTVIELAGKKAIELGSSETQIREEQDVLDLISACWEHGTELILLEADSLSEDFYKLRSGLAGHVLQKFVNYRMKAALVIPGDKTLQGKFKELIAESNKGNDFRVFDHRPDAEQWLIQS
ncbi:DUF4180 domain-containing protein [Cohnella herbarum]|uniref:DUF4180 domain-containing protein n=1 Tax=Cohnella herbarum TaxID=2728023 RepID=A0A7Z2VFR6_9BACL|nr:DUF4180 domain-containing protein [Cohnella herbarum]QJD82095.1 DUF4180 domain-containing protein [Cohnella herbarum]